MSEEEDEFELPRFSRPIGIATSPSPVPREDRLESRNGSIGVLNPFGGVLTLRTEPGLGTSLSLSYLTLRPLVFQERSNQSVVRTLPGSGGTSSRTDETGAGRVGSIERSVPDRSGIDRVHTVYRTPWAGTPAEIDPDRSPRTALESPSESDVGASSTVSGTVPSPVQAGESSPIERPRFATTEPLRSPLVVRPLATGTSRTITVSDRRERNRVGGSGSDAQVRTETRTTGQSQTIYRLVRIEARSAVHRRTSLRETTTAPEQERDRGRGRAVETPTGAPIPNELRTELRVDEILGTGRLGSVRTDTSTLRRRATSSGESALDPSDRSRYLDRRKRPSARESVRDRSDDSGAVSITVTNAGFPAGRLRRADRLRGPGPGVAGPSVAIGGPSHDVRGAFETERSRTVYRILGGGIEANAKPSRGPSIRVGGERPTGSGGEAGASLGIVDRSFGGVRSSERVGSERLDSFGTERRATGVLASPLARWGSAAVGPTDRSKSGFSLTAEEGSPFSDHPRRVVTTKRTPEGGENAPSGDTTTSLPSRGTPRIPRIDRAEPPGPGTIEPDDGAERPEREAPSERSIVGDLPFERLPSREADGRSDPRSRFRSSVGGGPIVRASIGVLATTHTTTEVEGSSTGPRRLESGLVALRRPTTERRRTASLSSSSPEPAARSEGGGGASIASIGSMGGGSPIARGSVLFDRARTIHQVLQRTIRVDSTPRQGRSSRGAIEIQGRHGADSIGLLNGDLPGTRERVASRTRRRRSGISEAIAPFERRDGTGIGSDEREGSRLARRSRTFVAPTAVGAWRIPTPSSAEALDGPAKIAETSVRAREDGRSGARTVRHPDSTSHGNDVAIGRRDGRPGLGALRPISSRDPTTVERTVTQRTRSVALLRRRETRSVEGRTGRETTRFGVGRDPLRRTSPAPMERSHAEALGGRGRGGREHTETDRSVFSVLDLDLDTDQRESVLDGMHRDDYFSTEPGSRTTVLEREAVGTNGRFRSDPGTTTGTEQTSNADRETTSPDGRPEMTVRRNVPDQEKSENETGDVGRETPSEGDRGRTESIGREHDVVSPVARSLEDSQGVDQLADQLYKELERKMRIERERRGL